MNISGSFNEVAAARRHGPHGLTTLPPSWPPVIFSTTYDCVEQDGTMGSWVTCDGLLEKFAQGTDPNDNWEQITTAANYSGGGGGRGQRHWVGQSHGNTNSSGYVRWRAADWGGGGWKQELWIRWYARFEAGLKLGGDSPPIARAHKVLYWDGGSAGQPGGCYFDIQGTFFGFIVAGTPYHDGTGWDGMFGGGVDAASDGRWILMELHIKNATGGLNNGLAQWWVDGVLQLDFNNVDQKDSVGFGDFAFPHNGQFTTLLGDAADMAVDLDELAVSVVGQIGPYSAVRGY